MQMSLERIESRPRPDSLLQIAVMGTGIFDLRREQELLIAGWS